jgi:glutamate carboxypeptidase
MRSVFGAATLSAWMICGAALAAPPAKPPARDSKLWAAAEAARPAQLQLLETLVNIDSGTGDVEGGRKIAAILKPKLEASGASVELTPAEADGLPGNLVATLKGTGKGRILMIAHMDTVFGPGTVAKWPYRAEGEHASGPGVGDEKGGVVEGLYALQLLHGLGFSNYAQITLLIETSEERGSTGTRNLIARLVREHDVELNLEPGDPPDVLTVWRKGSSAFHIEVKGRAAHAGIAPQEGRNAAVELIHQLAAIDEFPHAGPGTTVNLTLMQAGTRNNIIPETASATMSVRVREPAEFDRVMARLQQQAQTHLVPDTSVTVSRESSFPPMPNNAGTDALAARAGRIYAGIGRKIETGGNGGASESALAVAMGVPALDGLGPVGGGFHSDKEWIDLTTVTPRLYLLTKLIMELGANPPARLTAPAP